MAIEKLRQVGIKVLKDQAQYEKVYRSLNEYFRKHGFQKLLDTALEDIKSFSRNYGLPVAIDLSMAAFRGSRFGPPEGHIIASTTGIVHLMLDSLRQILVCSSRY